MLKKEIARNRAREIIESSGQSGPSVDLNEILERLKISAQTVDLVDGLAGMAFIKGNRKFIAVNAQHGENRRRFTIAHEIGHHVLHAELLVGQVHVDKTVLRRDEGSASGKDLMEIEANNFAAELLMPSSWLERVLPTGFDPEDEDFVRNLADQLRVSSAALYYKLLSSRPGRR